MPKNTAFPKFPGLEWSRPAVCVFIAWFCASAQTQAGALENYVSKPDTNYVWNQLDQKNEGGFTITHLELISQQWRESTWRHHLQVVRPEKVRNPGIAFLFITGDGDGKNRIPMLQILAQRAGAIAAVVTKVPNQPLYDGRKEDALIAYTFDQYLKSGDETWPLLFPMAKSAVRAMDAVQAFAQQEYKQKVEKFVVSGASKRGWTTWLTGAVDARVQAIAPMVIDMLNMRVQTDWADKVYGKQSEQIRDYTDLHLLEKPDDPVMVKLRGWVDPYSYRQRYNMPKLLLLGTNDPYWTVDSLRHYWSELPGPKLIF
jgi:PhoPQ-activated pathogenicity-related protein